ncbi:MAG: hypothetical protein CVV64_10165 [Candidatus Wallbacteria bacterium HGW-Wallbacteria-1]|jgi:hypothetical protein|uniref:Beta-ketoacyl synthase-like N-terminal domain-containing protein n=1 Tax=Candidatus Wallbacteria bacterium HGW-Wallbacteria-1 TaxID=2013854 RepID=A0A2N1PPW0_9BACT|nr:MAG: hypothetical protein CVV64_10165 [Candidatus Wallbacteria bacterium HGW-Wallbacteria-1]
MRPISLFCGEAVTPISWTFEGNFDHLMTGVPFFTSNLDVDGFTLSSAGRIDDSLIAEKREGLAVAARNLKFFDRQSVAVYHCAEKLKGLLAEIPAQRVGLYSGVGPANASVGDFMDWAEVNQPESDEPFSSMMASSVVRLLPNVVMANVSINLTISGENCIFSGTSMASVGALEAASRSLREKRCDVALLSGSSFPLQYFNIDSFNRFLRHDLMNFPLCEGASAVLLSADPMAERSGYLLDVLRWRCSIGADNTEAGMGRGVSVMGVNDIPVNADVRYGRPFDHVLVQPGLWGDFLSAGEPFGFMIVLEHLRRNNPSGIGVSICRDWFGFCSAIVVAGPKFSNIKY